MLQGDDIQALLLDVGQVIVRLDVPRAARQLGESAGIAADTVVAIIEADPEIKSFQEGRLSPERWHEHLQERLGSQLTFDEFCRVWNSALAPQPLLDGEFFSRLAPGLRLGLLSNTDPIHVKHLEAQFKFFSLFPVRMYSCEVGLRKPSPAIYQKAITALGVEPGRILYVDDVEEFVVAGARAGMQVHRFREAWALREELRRRRILPPDVGG